MRYAGKSFKSMKICLKELEPFIRNGNHLENGRRFQRFGNLNSREIFGSWLLCAVLNHERKSETKKICTDPYNGDGVIYDIKKKISYPMEHVVVTRWSAVDKDTEGLILEQINKKQNKGGAAYASGKTLVVFLNRKGEHWCPNRLVRKLPKDLDFESIWVVGLQEVKDDLYTYNVTQLNAYGCPIWQIHIDKDFNGWQVIKYSNG